MNRNMCNSGPPSPAFFRTVGLELFIRGMNLNEFGLPESLGYCGLGDVWKASE